MFLRFLLSPWIFYFLAILGLILAIVLVMKGKKQIIKAKVLEDKRDDDGYVYDLICAEFPGSCILKDVPVACKGNEKVRITQETDILYISRGGVIIISVVNGTGAFDNPKTGAWRFRYPDAKGKPVTVNIPNPFDATIPAANILEGILAGEKIYLDVVRIAVFSGDAVGMTTRYPEAMPVGEVVDYLRAFDQRPILNGPQFRTASEVITAFARYNQEKAYASTRPVTAKDSSPTQGTADAAVDEYTKENTGIVLDATPASEAQEEDEAIKLLKEIQLELEKQEDQKNLN